MDRPIVRWRYNEGANLEELRKYVGATYGQHYGNDKDEVQLFDYWHSLGILGTVARATAMKYLARFGKKAGRNRKDLLKAMHYILLALWELDQDEDIVTEDVPTDQFAFQNGPSFITLERTGDTSIQMRNTDFPPFNLSQGGSGG